MEKNSSWEANSSSTAHEIYPILHTEQEDFLIYSEELTTWSCPEPNEFSPHTPIQFYRLF
jgi:hypothetical protein